MIRPRRAPVLVVALIVLVAAGSVPSSSDAATSSRSARLGTDQRDRITSLPGYGSPETTQFAGYASGSETACSNLRCSGPGEAGLFYWFVGKAGATPSTPTVLWTNGGPGSTSFWGFFTENGPYVVGKDGHLAEREKAWNETANYLIFDQPLGVGLSSAPDDQLPANVQEGVDQWYRALVHFLERHPEVAAGPLILAGESYGGTYMPLLAKAILDGNDRAGEQVVRLGGIVLASGWVDPVVQQSMDTTMALSHGLITDADKARIDQLFDECRVAVEAQTPSSTEANDLCRKVGSEIETVSGVYLLNIAESGDPPTKPVVAYLNRARVREAIHAKKAGEFTMFSEPIGNRYAVGEQDSYRPLVEELLDRGVPIMIISGLNDMTDCNPLGTGAWLDLLEGDAAAGFHAAPTVQWKHRNQRVLGYEQDGGQLTWVKVLDAGHLAVADQPLLIDLIRDKLLTPAPEE